MQSAYNMHQPKHTLACTDVTMTLTPPSTPTPAVRAPRSPASAPSARPSSSPRRARPPPPRPPRPTERPLAAPQAELVCPPVCAPPARPCAARRWRPTQAPRRGGRRRRRCSVFWRRGAPRAPLGPARVGGCAARPFCLCTELLRVHYSPPSVTRHVRFDGAGNGRGDPPDAGARGASGGASRFDRGR